MGKRKHFHRESRHVSKFKVAENKHKSIEAIKVAEAKEPEVKKPEPVAGCEQYRSKVEAVFGQYTEEALFVAKSESGCQNIRSKLINGNQTWDYCIFQINNEPSALEIDICIKRAWEKFNASGKVWRQWYAVCPLDKKTRKQYQKFDHIPCFKR